MFGNLISGAARAGRRSNRRPARAFLSPAGRLIALLVATAILATAAGSALAYWRGSGSGSAVTVLPNTLPIGFTTGVPGAELAPGGSATVTIVATNPNPFFLQLAALELDLAEGEPFGVDAGHSDCDVSVLSFTAQDNGGAGWRIPPRVGEADGTLAIAMPDAIQMSGAAANACQGATFTVRLTAPS